MTLPKTRISRMFMALAGAGSLVLALSGCEPKPKHEIGKVEYDKLVYWNSLHETANNTSGLIGSTVTIFGLDYLGKGKDNPATNNSCLMNFGQSIEEAPQGRPSKTTIGVLVNYGSELGSAILSEGPDTAMENIPSISTANIVQDVCAECIPSDYDHSTKEYVGGSTSEKCLFQNRKTLFITGIVAASTGNGAKLFLVPTGYAW